VKLTLDAFGKPLEVEWISQDGRVLSSRTKSLELHSFPYLEKWDTSALRSSAPVKLTWKWIQHPRYGEEFSWPAKSPVAEVEVIRLEYAVPPMTEDEAHLQVEGLRWPDAASGLVLQELLRGTIKYSPKNSPDDLCWQIVSSEPTLTLSVSGVFVVQATLEDGTVVFLREESRRERLVPSAAQQYFLNQQIISHNTAAKEAPEKDDERLADPIPFGFDEWDNLVSVLMAGGMTKRDAVAVTLFAYGKSRPECAQFTGVSVRTIGRKLEVARETVYHRLFSRTKGQRAKARRDTLTAKILAQLRQRYINSVAN
jgi:hypothetical protein